jgi:hypothetical protein
MNDNDVYEQWKQERARMQPSKESTDRVMAQLRERGNEPTHSSSTIFDEPPVDTDTAEHANGRWLRMVDHPVAVAATLLAASLLGTIRLSLTFLLSGEAH